MTLRPHQQQMVRWILDTPRCAVWCPMGGGKTLAVLTAVDALRRIEPDFGPVLVIAPKRVARSTWPDEIRKWPDLGLTCSAIVGTAVERIKALSRPADVYTTNLENIEWLIAELDAREVEWPFRMVIVDESTRLKGFRTRQGTKRAKALGKLAHSHIERLVELTGTPASNGLLDLWGQLWFIDKGTRLGATYSAFTQRWFMSGWGGFGFTPLPSAQGEIQERVRDVCLTVTLPFTVDEPVVTDLYVELPPEVRRVYRELEREFFVALNDEDEITAVNAAALSNKCQQVANGAPYDATGSALPLHDAKLEALESVIEEAGGMPVLVAYSFKSDLARIKRRFPQARELDDNPQTITDWNAGKIPLLVFHPASAGHGLNLQHGGNILVWFGLNWSLELYAQAIERIGPLRQWQAGLNRPCLVYRILARDTVDELIAQRLTTKRDVQEILMEALKERT